MLEAAELLVKLQSSASALMLFVVLYSDVCNAAMWVMLCNVGIYLVKQALPKALTSARDDMDFSMPEADEVLMTLQPPVFTLMLLVSMLQCGQVRDEPDPALGPGISQR